MPRPRLTAAAHGTFTGAVVTLLPSDDDAARLALDGYEPPDALHVTLAWLGDTDGDPTPAVGYDQAVEDIGAALARATPDGPIVADAFAVATFNPAGGDRDPATVLLVQGDGLVDLRGLVVETVGDASSFPVWFPHLTLAYGDGSQPVDLDQTAVADRVGPIRFDRVRVAYGSDLTTEFDLTEGDIVASRARPAPRPATDRAALVAAGGTVGWAGVLTVEGDPTGDGRMFSPGAVRWDTPLPLRWAREDRGAHDGAVTVGRILDVWRDGDEVWGAGDLWLDIPEAAELAGLLVGDENGPVVSGVSADLDDVDIEIRVAADVLDDVEADFADPEGGGEVAREVDDDGRVLVWEWAADDELEVTTDARLRAATVVDIPAHVRARIELVEDIPDVDDAPPPSDLEELVAGSVPAAPPAAWFDDPQLDGPTPLTVDDDGRVYGHLATWGTCHTGFPGECVQPPRSATGYAGFHLGAVRTAEGGEVPVGRITLDTTHAGRRLSAASTVAHYENTGAAVADVRAGEDAHGIYVAGAVRPGLSDGQLRALRASPLSGDWRRQGGNLELVAALAVNSPGFPIPRALVAGGVVRTVQTVGVAPDVDGAGTMSGEDRALLASLLDRERRAAAARARRAAHAGRRARLAAARSLVASGSR